MSFFGCFRPPGLSRKGGSPNAIPAIPLVLGQDLPEGFLLNLKPEMFDNAEHLNAIFGDIAYNDGRNLRFSMSSTGDRAPMWSVNFDAASEEVEIVARLTSAVSTGDRVYLWLTNATSAPAPHQAYAQKAALADWHTAIFDWEASTDSTLQRTIELTGGAPKTINDFSAVGLGSTKGTDTTDRMAITGFSEPATIAMSFWLNPASMTGRLFERGNGGLSCSGSGGNLAIIRTFATTSSLWTVPKPSTSALTLVYIEHDGVGANPPKVYYNKTEQTVTTTTAGVGTVTTGSDLTLGNRYNGSSGCDADWSLFLLREDPLTEAELFAMYDNQNDPTAVATAEAIIMLSDPGFTDEPWIDPGAGYAGATDIIPSGRAMLLQLGHAFNNAEFDGDQYYANQLFRSNFAFSFVNADAVDDGFSDGVYPTWYAAQQGWLDASGYVVSIPSGTTQIRSGLIAILKENGVVTEDQSAQYVLNQKFQVTWDGGTGDDFLPPLGGSHYYAADNIIVYQYGSSVGAITEQHSISFDLTNGDPTTVRNIDIRPVTEPSTDTFVPDTTAYASKIFQDNTDHGDILRFMDKLPANVTPLRSIAEMCQPGDIVHGGNDIGSSKIRQGYCIREVLADTHSRDQIAWIPLLPMVGFPMRNNFLRQWSVTGQKFAEADHMYPWFEPGSFVKTASSDYGGVFTLDANGIMTYDSETPITGNTDCGFEYDVTDINGDVLHVYYQTVATTSGLIPPTQAAAATDNFASINRDICWLREADLLIDELVASGYPEDKKLIIDVGNESPWNNSGVFNVNWWYNVAVAQAIDPTQGAAFGYGWILARWMHAVRLRMFQRDSGPYNILWAIMGQTVNTAVGQGVFDGIKHYLSSVSLDWTDYIKEGHCELTLTTYTGDVYDPWGQSGIVASETAYNNLSSEDKVLADEDNHDYWMALVASSQEDFDDAFSAYMVSGTSHQGNAQYIVNNWAANDAVAVANNTRARMAYEGDHHIFVPRGWPVDGLYPNSLRDEPTFMAAHKACLWGEAGADVHREVHSRLATLYSGTQTVVTNYYLAGPHGLAGNPWLDASFYQQSGSARRAMFEEVGRNA